MEAASVSKAFEVAAKRAGLKSVRFYYLRDTAVTRLAEILPNLIALAKVLDQKSLSRPKRY